MADLFSEPRVLSLSELANGLSRVVAAGFPGLLWIRAEVAKLNHYPESGHCYPALVEKEKGKILAEMRGTIWANDFLRINRNFLQVTREPLREGIHILFRARVSFHPVYGLSLQIADIDPTYTLGEMAREKLATIERLKKEGLFDLNRQLLFPALPKNIAVISVKTSKGFSDFISIIENNSREFTLTCVLFPALLQGDKAVESILGQLERIRGYRRYFDAVAIIRGGGGDVGLNCYDHYALASAVATFPIPVLTGIGHSTNETVVEMVAGKNLITPTDLGYFLIQQFQNFSARLAGLNSEIASFAAELLDEEKKRLEDEKRKVSRTARLSLNEAQSVLELLSRDLGRYTVQRLHRGQLGIQEMNTRLRLQPMRILTQAEGQVVRQAQALESASRQATANQAQRIARAESQVRALDPVNVLKRGYSITYLKGKALKNASEAQPGEKITTRLASGTIDSEIISKAE
jgi:exodeoxyribonuclease VII large subunit